MRPPLHRLLGGYRDRVPCYVTCAYYREGKDLVELRDEMQQLKGQGHTGFKVKVGGLALAEDMSDFEVIRDVIGWENDLMIDVNRAGTSRRPLCGFRRMRTVIPIDCGQRFRSIADSVPVIADSGSRRRLQGLTRRCRCQAFHANPPVDTSSGPILLFDRHHPSAPTCTRLVPARTVAVKDGPSSGHRVSGAQRP